MNKPIPKIVVVTPVKNESWILERFLSVTSQFADYIIIADQNSTDGSQYICKKYSKVILVENKSDKFNEDERQILLLKTARDLITEHKIILALDADEILAANAIYTQGWQSMLQAEPGTVLYFEKLDLFSDTHHCIRANSMTPLGYVDDGAEHIPQAIHSVRIPVPDYAIRLHIHDVKVMHYTLTRLEGQDAKIRLYLIIENVLKKSHPLARRYGTDKCFRHDYSHIGEVEKSCADWFTKWEEIGIDMHTIVHQKYYSYDFEVLRYFKKYGLRRFALENIWHFDWEACRQYAKSLGMSDIPDYPIPRKNVFLTLLLNILGNLYYITRMFVKFLLK